MRHLYGSEDGRLRGGRATLPVHLLVGEVSGVAEPGNELAAGAGGQGRLRASHADREQVIGVLKTAFVQGRLDRDEFDLRVGRALASRTYADLAALTADIPAWPARARPPEPARESVSKKAVAAAACATAAFIGMWPVMLLTPDGSPFAVPVVVVWFVLAMAVPTGWLVLLHDWLDKRAVWQSAQGLPPGAGGAASQRPAPADPARQLPQSSHDLRHTAKSIQSRLPSPQVPGMRPPRRGNPLGRRYALGCSSH
jgi:DUF1707 SHOCT-like domain